jgi:hypothetical protein
MSTTLKMKVVTTRKKHRCFSCCRLFPEGTKLNYYVGIVEGDFSAVYSCNTCAKLMNIYAGEYDYFEQGFANEICEKGQTPEELLKEKQK